MEKFQRITDGGARLAEVKEAANRIFAMMATIMEQNLSL